MEDDTQGHNDSVGEANKGFLLVLLVFHGFIDICANTLIKNSSTSMVMASLASIWRFDLGARSYVAFRSS